MRLHTWQEENVFIFVFVTEDSGVPPLHVPTTTTATGGIKELDKILSTLSPGLDQREVYIFTPTPMLPMETTQIFARLQQCQKGGG